MEHDRFGNPIDPAVGYARGRILRSSLEEFQRRAYALSLARERVRRLGRDCIYNFTGHRRGFLAQPDDLLHNLAEEWVGSTLIEEQFTTLAREHFGASRGDAAALLNRSAAGIVSLLLALAPAGSRVVSVAPNGRSHPSIRRGAALARAILDEREPQSLDANSFKGTSLIVLTRVTSELDIMSEDDSRKVVELARHVSVPLFLDDAYGARVAPVLLSQPKSLAFGADLAITSCDKAGLGGPRAGLMVGRAELVEQVVARASELGFEARGPLLLGVLRALEKFEPEALCADARTARLLTNALKTRLGDERVLDLPMGPTITEDDIQAIVLELAGDSTRTLELVPAEVSCLLGMVLLVEHGVLTSNAAERPGARVSLRLRPSSEEVERFGGPEHFVTAMDESLHQVSQLLAEPFMARRFILGVD